tara:strand:- start:2373 stop:3125 length:753 start_codon:yes stop_codon:yes gene_type:complete
MRLQGKTCLVTGGSSGIGAAAVKRFVQEGAKVIIVDLNIQDATLFAEKFGDSVTAFECDVRSGEGVKRLADAIHKKWAKIDVLVNNAGWELNKAYDETEEEEWYRVIDTDLKGPWLMCKYFVPPMVKSGRGSVINISSLNGIVGFPLSTAYGSAKGGLVVFTRDMAIELAKSGVRVNCVCPGVIDTAMMERWTDLMPDKNEAKKMLTEVMPIGRMGTADEVAGAILFFASEDSALCQGSVLACDGGFTAQ